jgi:hypothetical protein
MHFHVSWVMHLGYWKWLYLIGAYIFQTMKNNWWIFGTWQQKYLEKVENFSFCSVNLRKNAWNFENFANFQNHKTEF